MNDNHILVLYECRHCGVLITAAEHAAFDACEDCFDYWNDPDQEPDQ